MNNLQFNLENIFTTYKDVVTVKELQKMLGIGRNLAYKLINEGKIKHLKINNKILIPKIRVIEFITPEVQDER